MTPQEKAMELADRFYMEMIAIDCHRYVFAVACAIISVDDTIKALTDDAMLCKQSKRAWWQEVRNELSKQLKELQQ